MGYDLHITRKQNWFDDEGETISHDEWKNYVLTDSEIIQDPDNSETDYLYLREPENWPLWWREDTGEVYTKNPDKDVVIKMFTIAEKLGATLQGDDCEVYDESGNSNMEQLLSEGAALRRKLKPWWKFWG